MDYEKDLIDYQQLKESEKKSVYQQSKEGE